jgi:phosphatidylserine/phosphatidylglycerophosphate/cardiolipin synthase-like enzyme
MLTCALGPDNLGPLLCELIEGAKESIDASVYELGPSYVSVLKRAVKAGVAVRVLLDAGPSENLPSARALAAAGADVRVLTLPKSFVHWKFLVVDGQTVALGSGNLVQSGAPYEKSLRRDTRFKGTREWWLGVRENPELAKTLSQSFSQWFSKGRVAIGSLETDRAAAAAVGLPPLQVPPLDIKGVSDLDLATSGSGVLAQLEAGIAGAEQRLWVTTPYMFAAGDKVKGLLRKISESGVPDRRVLLGEMPHRSDMHALAGLDVEIRVMNPKNNTRGHAKGAIFDSVVVVSSANWNEPGLSTNLEAALMVKVEAAAEYFAAAFERDWDLAEASS